jgi:UDP-3-O-[3-hydroxymyristoyl] glucosamine N-acyltransferase
VTWTLAAIAELVEGEFLGDGAREITAALPLHESHDKAITLISHRRYLNRLDAIVAGGVIVGRKLLEAEKIDCAALVARGQVGGTIVVNDPLAATLRVALKFQPAAAPPEAGVHPQAFVHPTALVGAGASIGPFAHVGARSVIGERAILHPHAVVREDCRVGREVEIHPHAVLYPRTEVGDHCILHSGVVLGCDGFGYVLRDGRHVPVPQLGKVVLQADVEIGANSAVDRATLGSTVIGEGTKVDNLAQIAHNCRLGSHNIIVGQVGLAGSVTTGSYVVIAGQTGVADHVTIGDRAVIGARSGLYTDVPAGETYLGLPAKPERDVKRDVLNIERLSELRRQMARVVRHLNLTAPVTEERKAG